MWKFSDILIKAEGGIIRVYTVQFLLFFEGVSDIEYA